MKQALFEHGSKEGYIKEIKRLEDENEDLRQRLACALADQIAKVLDGKS